MATAETTHFHWDNTSIKEINTTKFSISSCIFAHLKISLIVNNDLDQIFETKENKH